MNLEDKNSRLSHNPEGNIAPFAEIFSQNPPPDGTWIDNVFDITDMGPANTASKTGLQTPTSPVNSSSM